MKLVMPIKGDGLIMRIIYFVGRKMYWLFGNRPIGTLFCFAVIERPAKSGNKSTQKYQICYVLFLGH